MKLRRTKEELDVDIRFLLANERTLLAWIRTGLTLIAGGVAVAFIYVDSAFGTLAGLGAIVFGGMLSMIGYKRFQVADAAIRRGELPRTGRSGIVVVVGVVIFALALVAGRAFGFIH